MKNFSMQLSLFSPLVSKRIPIACADIGGAFLVKQFKDKKFTPAQLCTLLTEPSTLGARIIDPESRAGRLLKAWSRLAKDIFAGVLISDLALDMYDSVYDVRIRQDIRTLSERLRVCVGIYLCPKGDGHLGLPNLVQHERKRQIGIKAILTRASSLERDGIALEICGIAPRQSMLLEGRIIEGEAI